MPRARKACGTCGQPSTTTPCPDCSEPRTHHLTRSQRGYDNAWLRLRDRALRRQPWCAWCGSTEDLTGDHIVPISQAPERRLDPTNVQILCRTCNSRKRDRRDPSMGVG